MYIYIHMCVCVFVYIFVFLCMLCARVCVCADVCADVCRKVFPCDPLCFIRPWVNSGVFQDGVSFFGPTIHRYPQYLLEG